MLADQQVADGVCQYEVRIVLQVDKDTPKVIGVATLDGVWEGEGVTNSLTPETDVCLAPRVF